MIVYDLSFGLVLKFCCDGFGYCGSGGGAVHEVVLICILFTFRDVCIGSGFGLVSCRLVWNGFLGDSGLLLWLDAFAEHVWTLRAVELLWVLLVLAICFGWTVT